MTTLRHRYGVKGYKVNKNFKQYKKFSHVCYAGIDEQNMEYFDQYFPAIPDQSALPEDWDKLRYQFVRDAVKLLGHPDISFIGAADRNFVVRFHTAGHVFRLRFLGPATLLRYATEFPSCVLSYHELVKMGLTRDLAFALCTSVYALDKQNGERITCVGGRGNGHSWRCLRIDWLDKKFSLAKCTKHMLAEGGMGETRNYYVPDGCTWEYHAHYHVGNEKLYGSEMIDAEWVKAKYAAAPNPKGNRQKRAAIDKALVANVNYIIDIPQEIA